MAKIVNNQLVETWGVDDIKSQCPWLNDQQALEVMEEIVSNYDCGIGINWDVIDAAAFNRHPKPDNYTEVDDDGGENGDGDGESGD